MKRFLFRFYWLVAILGAFGCLLALRATIGVSAESVAAVIAGSLSFVYFVHTQKLEEIKLFKQLFTEFNQRYDSLNEPLYGILHGNSGDTLNDSQVSTLTDYFNLCAEEYFYYKHGYIDSEVWKAWSNGMKLFFNNARIKKLWQEEKKTESYYGFEP